MIGNWEACAGKRGKKLVEVYKQRWAHHCRSCCGGLSSAAKSASAVDAVDRADSPSDTADTTREHEYEYAPYSLKSSQRVWAISDIHVDFPANMSWLFSLPRADTDGVAYAKGTLVLAGDVCHALPMLRTTLRFFKKKFQHVFYCVGNHELWLTHTTTTTSAATSTAPTSAVPGSEGGGATARGRPPQVDTDFDNSVEKFFAIVELCRSIGVHTTPAWVGEPGRRGACFLIVDHQLSFGCMGGVFLCIGVLMSSDTTDGLSSGVGAEV